MTYAIEAAFKNESIHIELGSRDVQQTIEIINGLFLYPYLPIRIYIMKQSVSRGL